MPPPPPKSSAPAPPKSKAPPPPPGGANRNRKTKSKAKPKSNPRPKTTYNNNNKNKQNINEDDSTYDLGKKAAKEAGSAAKMALFSLGSKMKKDMKSFTKSELEIAGVDTTKPIVKKPTIIKKVKKEIKKPAPPPAQLKSVNMDWKQLRKIEKNKPQNNKNKPKNSYNNNNKSKPKPPYKNGTNYNQPKSTQNKRKPPPRNPMQKNKSTPTKKKGLSNRMQMFEQHDRNAGNGKNVPQNPPKIKKQKSKSNGFWSKNKSSNSNKDKREKNLKPSLLKNKKKSPPLKAKEAPPEELKAVNVDWKQQRKKMANVFKKKEEDKNKENKLREKSKEFMSTMKKMKASVTAESADPNKAAPKKLEFNLFKKSKSVETETDEKKSGNMNIPAAPKQLKFSKSADHDTKGKKMVPPPPPAAALSGNKSSTKFNIVDVNQKIAKPTDYNEIQFKAVDAMELRRQQKRHGGGRYARTAQMVANKPTTANNMSRINNNNINKNSKTNNISNNNNNNKKKKAKPKLPSAPPPKPKPKAKQKPTKSIERQGVLEVMPTATANGWIYSAAGMFVVNYKDNIKDIKKNRIYQGFPLVFDTYEKNAKRLRLLRKIDVALIKTCMTKKGKTKYDAKYYIENTEFEFNGNLSCNAFEIPKDCNPNHIGVLSEKIVNAFVNTNGGTVYIGIDNTWNVKGVSLKGMDLEAIKQCVMLKVHKFVPKLNNNDLKKFKCTSVAIVTKDGVLCEDIIVIKIIVPGSFRNEKNDVITYATANGDKFRKNLNYIMKVIM